MKFDPVLPEHNNNISPVHPLKEFATLAVGLLLFFVSVYLVLGLFVDVAVSSISPEVELAIFNHVPLSRLEDNKNGVDPRQAKLQELTDSLRQCLDITIPVRVYLQESSAANAMALPGGRIVVLSGLLDKVDSENGLSFVLGHELGHIKHRDHLRGLGRGLVIMALAAAISGPDSSLTRMATPTVGLTQAKYSQGRESMADNSGLAAINCYYGHVGGAAEFFSTMLQQKGTSSSFSHFFASHPDMTARIEALQQQARANNWQSGQTIPLILPETNNHGK